MIFVRDKGRMCNNLLQYGHVYAWAREHGRQSMSMRFAYKYPYFHISETPHHHFLCYVFAKFLARIGLLPVVSFDGPDAPVAELEQKMRRHKHIVVEGWYVRFYDLFLKYKDEIKQLFAFREDISQAVSEKLEPCQGDFLLGLHVRRGDYKRWKDGKYLYSDMQYVQVIRQAMRLFKPKKVRIFICGNDPDMDKDVFRHAFGSETVLFPNGSPGEDLCLLSRCDALIGAPSTFSLVASMYNDVPLYWILDAGKPLARDDFKHFDFLFRNIL